MNRVETRIRVRYAETDQMGVVYYANYLVWMEVGRVEYCKARGFNHRDMERDGVFLVVVEAECRYLAPAFFDDEVIEKIPALLLPGVAQVAAGHLPGLLHAEDGEDGGDDILQGAARA